MPALTAAENGARLQFESTFLGLMDVPELNARLTTLRDGQSVDIVDSWDTSIRLEDHRPGDYAAIGQSSVHSEGRFRAGRRGDVITITGDVTHRLGAIDPTGARPNYYRDPFDFQGGQPGSFPAITLQDAGEAKAFDMVSESPSRKG